MCEKNIFLQTDHPHILRFYSKNPLINFETMNLVLVDFLERIVLDTKITDQEQISSSFQSQMCTYMKQHTNRMTEITDSLETIKESMHKTSENMTACIIKMCLELRNDYIKELKIIVNQETIEHIFPILERNNNQLIDKTTIMINEVVPKSQYPYYQQIQDSIRFFQKSITEDTQKLLHYTQTPDSIDNNNIMNDFITHFENKSNQMIQNIQQPIYSYISSSEERIHSNLANIKDITMKTYGTQEKISKDLGDYLRTNSPPTIVNLPNPSAPIIQRNQIHNVISRIFPTSEISKIHKPTNGSPIVNSIVYTMKRANHPKIAFESKTCENNISVEEIAGFIEVMKHNHTHGILISHNSGFFNKPNYHIENHDGYILVYIHFVEYNPDKIKSAVDIIDQLSSKIKQYGDTHANDTGEDHNCLEMIDKTILEEINKEYQLFVSQKESIIQNLREGQRKIVSQIEEFQFSSLERYLSSKFTTPVPKNGHRCDLCKVFNANNLKALAAHKRGCIRKNGRPASVNENNPNMINQIDTVTKLQETKLQETKSTDQTMFPSYDDVSYTNYFTPVNI